MLSVDRDECAGVAGVCEDLGKRLAPIGVSTYARLEHLKKTISALQNNHLAGESVLYIFSDAPKPGDEDKVQAVRDYLKTIRGFRQVNVVGRKTNNRVRNNRDGMRMLLEEHGRMIFLEEDVETAPGFLTYMNQALDKYEDNPEVFSVSGYCPPIQIPENYFCDVLFSRRFYAWGCAFWRDRFKLIESLTEREFFDLYNDRAKVASIINDLGGDFLPMLYQDAAGAADALDIKIMYTQHVLKKMTVLPTCSLTKNIGMDGSGTHCGSTSKFDVNLSHKNIFMLPDVTLQDSRIASSMTQFNRGSFRLKIRVFFLSCMYRFGVNVKKY